MTDARPAWHSALLRHLTFDTRGNVIRICSAVCLLTALGALLLGQDANWDLLNYHLYNGWAALHGRLSIDLMPAQLQSYFVPWLDVGYYLLAVKGSPMLAGAVLGALHGLAFASVAAVAWLTLEGDPRRVWLAPLLGLAGCCSAIFLSELGNTMGDNTTAPLVIGALALALRAARTDAARHWLLAGLLLGLALAFKLTNAPYALGLGIAALAIDRPWPQRLRGTALLTLAALAVFALVAGPWFWRVYQQFGNPLFPLFNQWFHAPLASPLPSSDLRWEPKSAVQALIWPLLITATPGRISEIGMHQLVWGLLYLLAALAIVQATLRRMGCGWSSLVSPNQRATRMLAVFVLVGFVAWMAVFSIHRYLIALELVAPLALWLLARRTLPAVSAEKWAAGLVAACALVGCAAVRDWGHQDWAKHSFTVETPNMEQPATATVLVPIVGEAPQAWRIPFLPRQAAYMGITANRWRDYEAHIQQIAANRGGAVYAMFPGTQKDAPCQCSTQQADDPNRALIEDADTQLRARGWQLRRDSCTVHASYIGRGNYPFHWCEVTRLP
ncbi:MAG: glycosyltransferase family 39 protein [Burkholderiaceae bacterium]|jgi:hypothetical protein|nr:glycosyltransferase family 39 protein [Burkholderiaceae bacterium]